MAAAAHSASQYIALAVTDAVALTFDNRIRHSDTIQIIHIKVSESAPILHFEFLDEIVEAILGFLCCHAALLPLGARDGVLRR